MTALKDAIGDFRRGFETSDGEMLVKEEPVEPIDEKEVETGEGHQVHQGPGREVLGRERQGMGAQLRAVRRRIKSVQSTAKITRAQELIAASRIIKAQQRAHAAAPYASEITRAVEAVVSRSGQIDHPLTSEPENRSRAAVLIMTSDRGFCGGYNANVLREAQGLRAMLAGHDVEAVPLRDRTQGNRLAPVPRH